MENAMMTDKLLKRKVLFNCADTIESLKCFQCVNFKTHNLVHLNYHSKAGHTLLDSEEKLYKCESCEFLTYSKFLSLIHQLLNLCTRSKKIKSNKTPSKSISNTHGNMMHKSGKNKSSKCKHCPFTTKTPRNLKSHILFKHTDPDKIRWFQCAQCSLKFKTKSCLNKHIAAQHGSRAFLKCDQCPLETKYPKSLKRHILSKHTTREQIERFECAQCSFKSIHKSSLKQHMECMHVHRILVKCEHCPFETKHGGVLKRHILSKHTDPAQVQWYKCAQCPFKTHRQDYLQKHMNTSTHGNKAKLKCDECPFETTSKKSLARHLLSKYSDRDEFKWFCCEHCSYQSTIKEDLLQHKKDAHHQTKTPQS